MTTPENSMEKVRKLQNQISWIVQLSSAITGQSERNDIITMLLAGLISPNGLGFSRVLFFEHDDEARTMRGRLALFHESRATIEEIAKELAEEDAFIERRRATMMETPTADSERTEEELNSLSQGVQWITLVQRLNPENSITERIQKLAFPTDTGRGRTAQVFQEIAQWRAPRALTKEKLGSRLPPALANILPDEFAIAPVRTARGLRGAVIVDHHLGDGLTVSRDELAQLDWFTSQAALSLDNQEVNHDLARAYQELKQLDQMKSNFLSIISHELRTPLTAMSGFVELIIDQRVGPINENQKMLLGRVAKNTGHLVHLVNDLIEVAEIEAEGTVEVRIGPVEPLSVLMDTLPKLEQRRREKHVQVVPELAGDLPTIQTDERALGRVFFHLIDNAIKFSNEGCTVVVRFRPEEGELLIDVEDEGMGIPEDNLKYIFNQFYQVDNSLTRGHEGLGLGLAVTKMLVQASRGRIMVRSEVGQGSCFTVAYPLSAE